MWYVASEISVCQGADSGWIWLVLVRSRPFGFFWVLLLPSGLAGFEGLSM